MWETRTSKQSHFYRLRTSLCKENHQKSFLWDYDFRVRTPNAASFDVLPQTDMEVGQMVASILEMSVANV